MKASQKKEDRIYSRAEEVANSITHGIASLLSIAGLAILVGWAVAYNATPKVITAVAIFGVSMIFLYMASTLYHAVTHRGVKRILQIVDHAAIYLLIAGSYTPYCLITLGGTIGVTLCIAVWSIAILGISCQSYLIKKADWVNSVLYLIMGWLVVFAIGPLIDSLPTMGLYLLVGGGVAYSVGVIFFLLDSKPFAHTIWHLFVFAGTALQFFSILFYVIPQHL